jgi:hypothetical protein
MRPVAGRSLWGSITLDHRDEASVQAACRYSLISPLRILVRRTAPLPFGTIRAHASGGRRLLQRAMRAVGVVVLLVLGQHTPELTLTDDQRAVQTLTTDRADPPLGITRWPSEHEADYAAR